MVVVPTVYNRMEQWREMRLSKPDPQLTLKEDTP
jgi:hypothetical protein